jgi:predicted nucleotidyltransferase
MAQTAKTQPSRLMLSPKVMQKALEQSAKQAQRLADAFGVEVPSIKPKKPAWDKDQTRTAHKIPITGMIKPIMGISTKLPASSTMADALFPKVRQRVLAVLFGNSGRSFYANEVIALAQSGSGAVQRELQALSEAGLLTVTKQGNQKHYQANAVAPVFSELRGLVLKTMGLSDTLKIALAPLLPHIELAFVYGSVAKQQDTAHSDIDVMIVSASLGYGEVFGALESAATTLGRKVNPTLYAPAEISKRIRLDNAFVTRVLQQPKIWLIGSEEQLHVPST